MRGSRWVLALVGLLAVLVSCGGRQEEKSIEFRVPVRAHEVGTGDVMDRVIATGNLRAPHGVAVTVETAGVLTIASSKRTGRRWVEGDVVEEGQLLASITGEEVRLAARLEATRQSFESAKRDYDSKEKLFEAGLVSEQELIQAEAALADARLSFEQSEFTKSRTNLTAPISGVIMSLARDSSGVPVADGQKVAVGFTVAEIAPLRKLIADVKVLGPDINKVAKGQDAILKAPGMESKEFRGRVARLAPALDPGTHALTVEVEVDNARLVLRPGAFVEVTLVAQRRKNVIVVPREAVTERAGRKVVFVLRGQRVSEREVRLGLGNDDTVEVRGGLEKGEKIVIKGLETLTDESRVRLTGS